MANFDYDLFVIGAGSGGVRAARIAASQYGARVGICEQHRVGGTCVIRGCVPKKLFVYASRFADEFKLAADYGWSVAEPSFDWPTLMANKDREIARLNEIYIRLLTKAGCDLMDGTGRIIDPHTVEVNGKSITARYILIAVGGWPTRLDIPGGDLGVTSNEIFELKQMPDRMTVIGGGYIACEFAGIFNALGCEVTQLYRSHQILRGFDAEVRDFAAREMIKRGVNIRTDINITSAAKHDDGTLELALTDGTQLETDLLLYATGRSPLTSDLGAREAGVELTDWGSVRVNDYSQTSVESIYAVGDVTDRLQLTPIALAEGHAFVDTVFGDQPRVVNHQNVATAVFSQPEIATVGLAEHEARDLYDSVDVYRSAFRPLKLTMGRDEDGEETSVRNKRTLMKMLVEPESDRVIGVHMAGAGAAEIMQSVAVAIQCEATKAQFDRTIGIHPTSAEEFVTMREKVN